MFIYMDKRDRSELFRTRLAQALSAAQLSQAGLASAAQTNRSTISQLLDPGDTRLPNAHLAAECAHALGVSADWLLGLTDRPERAADIVDATVQISEASRAPSDSQVFQWHKEADGYKVRHVPATLPDFLKTRATLEWEYGGFLGKTPEQAIAAMEDRLEWFHTTNSDFEICLPRQEVVSLLQGQSYYADMPPTVRAGQVKHLYDLCDRLFPSVRLFLFDRKKYFSAPLSIFGHKMAALYIGNCYLAFRESSRIRTLIQHFDNLVRHAEDDNRSLDRLIKTYE